MSSRQIRMKDFGSIAARIVLSLSCVIFIMCFCTAPAETGAVPVHHAHGHTRVRRPPPRRDPAVNVPVWIDIYDDYDDDEEDDGTVPYELKADGVVTVVPNSPSKWISSVDVAANRFTLSAPLTLAAPVASPDVAQIRAVFNSSVDRKSVDSLIDPEKTRLTLAGEVAFGESLNRVELLQIVVERADGVVFVQNISIGLNF